MSATKLKLSNSKVKVWRRCPKRYEYDYVQQIEPKKRELPLELGSWVHTLLEHHYQGKPWRKAHAKLAQQFNNLFEEEREELPNLPDEAERLMTAYLRRYAQEDEPLEVLDAELDEIVSLPNGIDFQFIIDLVVAEDGGLWLWDHKTLSQFMRADFMLIDAQLARYFYCAKLLGLEERYGLPLRGVLFNEIRTKAPAVPEMLKSGRLTERANLDTDVFTYYEAIKAAGLKVDSYVKTLARLKEKPDAFFRRTRMPRDAAMTKQMMRELVMSAREIQRAERTGDFPRTVEKACSWDCPFLDPCIVELQGGDPSDIIKLKYRRKSKRPKKGRNGKN